VFHSRNDGCSFFKLQYSVCRMRYFKIKLKLLQWWGWNRCQIYLHFWGYVDICLHSRTSQSDAAHSVKVLALCVPVDKYVYCALLATEMCHIKSKVRYMYFERIKNWSLILNFPQWMGTEHAPSNGNASDLYLGCSRFESGPEYLLSCMMYFVVSSFSPGKYWNNIFELDHDPFLQNTLR
jgi:hypothetical protein